MNPSEWFDLLRGAKCEVIGLGVSNLPLVGWLAEHGASVTARDRKTREELGADAKLAERCGARLILGDNYLDGLCGDVIFRSPGLRPDDPAICAAVKNGAILSSEMELFLDLTPATVLGVTGSDGKTTTTTLTSLFLKQATAGSDRRVFVGGNIGEPLLPRVAEMRAGDFAVVELSSFQLQTVNRSPYRAAITNLSPNHLNWHTDMAEYTNAKTNILSHPECTRAVLNAENGLTREIGEGYDRPVTWFSSARHAFAEFDGMRPDDRAVYERDGWVILSDGKTERKIVRAEEILLPGRHNLENYMTAIALTDGYVTPTDVGEVARTFGGVAHRLERVATVDGVTYYNSSIDSSPSRTAAALSALKEKPIVICGGRDKHVPFDPLAEALFRRAKAVVLTGEAAGQIRAAIDAYAARTRATLPVYGAPLFDDAVRMARDLAKAGDTVLLSPACTSFDAFRNFEERGRHFCELVRSFESKKQGDKKQ